MSTSDRHPPADPTVAAEVARAIRPYRAVVPADAAAQVRARLAALRKHPVGASIVAQLVGDTGPDEPPSGG